MKLPEYSDVEVVKPRESLMTVVAILRELKIIELDDRVQIAELRATSLRRTEQALTAGI